MSDSNLARIILRSNGDVHIAFYDIRSIHATPQTLSELFSDPIEFITNTSLGYEETTFETNRKRVPLEQVLGLTLAVVNRDKQIICHFPELFQYIFTKIAAGAENDKLNMKSVELETLLSDEKAYLLRFYLEFTNSINKSLVIKNNLKLREELLSDIIRETLDTFFKEELPNPLKLDDIFTKISKTKKELDPHDTVEEIPKDKKVNCTEYAKILGVSPQTVYQYVSQGRIKSAEKDQQGRLFFNKDDRPIEWNMKFGKKRERKSNDKFYRRPPKGSAADVEENIKRLKLFTDEIAPYIHTYDELDYYKNHRYREVCWDGIYALVIDVNPEYISSITGKSNRERMLAGKPPVVPDRNKEEYVYHVHHIGQHSTSPFAIIPEYDHERLSSVLHQSKPNTELHGPEFEAIKANFWRNYLKHYDAAGKFLAMKFLNTYKK